MGVLNQALYLGRGFNCFFLMFTPTNILSDGLKPPWRTCYQSMVNWCIEHDGASMYIGNLQYLISPKSDSETERLQATWCHTAQYHLVLIISGVSNVKKSCDQRSTLQGINISHLGKRKIIFKMPIFGDMLVPWRVYSWLIMWHTWHRFHVFLLPAPSRWIVVGDGHQRWQTMWVI